VTDWQPIVTAPENERILVCNRAGHVQIARTAFLRWYDDDGRLLDIPEWWAPLPEGPTKAATAAVAASAMAGSKTVKRRRTKPRA
jgi:hypothetical protein